MSPVFNKEAWKTTEIAFVAGDERRLMRVGDGGNQQIRVIKPGAFTLQLGFPPSEEATHVIGGLQRRERGVEALKGLEVRLSSSRFPDSVGEVTECDDREGHLLSPRLQNPTLDGAVAS